MHYMLFDVLYLEGHSMMDRPYEERREALESMELEGPTWQTPRYHRGEGAALLEASARPGPGGRGGEAARQPLRARAALVGVDQGQEQAAPELVIGGWLPEKERSERLGALLVGYHDEQGKFRYAGRVGTGWDAKERARLERAAGAAGAGALTVRGQARPRGARYVEPAAGRRDRVHGVDQRRDAAPSVVQGVGGMEPRGGVGEPGASGWSAVGNGRRPTSAGGGGGPRQRGNDGFARAGRKVGQERGRGGGRGPHAAAVQPRQARCIRRRDSPRAT